MTEEIIIDECFNCKKKKDIGDNWRTCKLKCSYKYKRKENDYITHLEQENKDFEILAKSLYKRIEELEKENEALAFRERLYKADYEASEQENKELKEENSLLSYNLHIKENEAAHYLKEVSRHRSALEEINILAKNYCNACDEFKAKTYKNKNDCLYCNYGFIKRKINEVLNDSEC